MKILSPEYVREDDRGKLVQVVTGDFKQLNCLEIKEAQSFGYHYHKDKEEVFFVSKGVILLDIDNELTGVTHSQLFTPGTCFLVERCDRHTITGITDAVLIEVMTEVYNKDDVHI